MPRRNKPVAGRGVSVDHHHTERPVGANRLLGPADLSPAGAVNARSFGPFLLIGDHAGRAIPAGLGTLGLSSSAMDSHIAWDIGVLAMGRRLAKALDAPFVHQRYSRLVIDCNREPGRDDSIPVISDGVVIPGNAGLDAVQRAARRTEIYEPYHARIAAFLDRLGRHGPPAALVSLHSFTPSLQGHARPWAVGVLHRNDSALSDRLLALLRGEMGDEAGDNQPYAMDEVDNTVPLHADPRGLDYLELEIRQDLIADHAGQARMGDVLARLLQRAWASR